MPSVLAVHLLPLTLPKDMGISGPQIAQLSRLRGHQTSTSKMWLSMSRHAVVTRLALLPSLFLVLHSSPPLIIEVAEEIIPRAGYRQANAKHRWVYLFFFNTIWVWIPLWILYQGYGVFTSALNTTASKQKKR